MGDITVPGGGGGLTSPVGIADGGTGEVTAANALTALGGVPTTGVGSDLTLLRLSGSTYSTLQHWRNNLSSAGVVSGGVVTDAGGNTVNVTSGSGTIRNADAATAPLYFMNWNAVTGLSVPLNATRYIGVEYAAGIAQATVRTTDVWNYHTEFPLAIAVNEAGAIHILASDKHTITDLPGSLLERFEHTQPFARDSRAGGIILGETGTRNITVSAGYIWEKLTRFTIPAFNSSTGGTFETYYRTGGSFTKTAGVTQWDNLNWDNAGVLTALSVNKYGVHWFYLEPDDGMVVMVYGRGEYGSAAAAELEAVPATVPAKLLEGGTLIGRLIFQKSAATASIISSAYSVVFSPSQVASHAALSNLDFASAGHTGALPIANGGTNSTTASAARTSLGAAASGANSDITSLTALVSINDGPLAGLRNVIIGGNFATNPWQRGTSFTAPANGAFTADRWAFAQSSDAVLNVLKTADAPSASESGTYSTHCLHADVTTADGTIAAGQFCLLRHRVEGYNCAQFGFGQAGVRYVTLSFWHKHTKTGTYCVSFRNNGDGKHYIAEYSQVVTDVWEKAVITLAVDTGGTWVYDSGMGLVLDFVIASGTDYHSTQGVWGTGLKLTSSNQVNGLDNIANNFKIALVQLEQGSTATYFENRPHQQELALCQRYYLDRQGYYDPIMTGYASGSNTIYMTSFFPTIMRASPTVTKTGTWAVNNCGQPSALAGTPHAASFSAVTTGTGTAYAIANGVAATGFTADAEL